MPEEMVKAMREGGGDNPYALMNAAGIKHGESMKKAKRKMSSYGKNRSPSAQDAGNAIATQGE